MSALFLKIFFFCRGAIAYILCRTTLSFSPWVINFETRREYFYYTAFGSVRALQRFKRVTQGDDSTPEMARLSRIKVRVSRNRVMESVYHVMGALASAKLVLEIEFFDEVGTGLGPTMEFYALASQAFRHSDYGLWRADTCKPVLPSIER